MYSSPRTWSELRYAVTGLPVAVAGFACVAVLLGAGLVLAITVVGLPVLVGGLHVATWLGALERRRAAAGLGVTVAAPVRPAAPPDLLGRIRARLADPAGWRAALHALLKPVTAFAGLGAVTVFWAGGLAELTYPIWRLAGLTQQWGGAPLDDWPRSLLAAAVGAVLLLFAPRAVHGALALDRLLARKLLGPTRYSERLRHLESTRSQVVDDSAAMLRRIERDLHDGAQARMVAVTMDLVTAKKILKDGDPEKAGEVIDLAHRNATAAVTELRDLARGIHPAALDRGLDTALATLASHSAVPVTLRVALPRRPAKAIESIVYFCAAELLANVLKHSRAEQAWLEVTQDGDLLRLRVQDNGAGGAVAGATGGLAGLGDRVRAVDGRLTISSPPGGPTLVVVELPIRL
ncbi:signal transduction histidine kinase [Thermocatellispora tengchongensis]|uniref:histidine kinase n=1 Tax=Thermocatellispora tengchongensis TaxID=1073253 RepID=A0A840PHW1_9ACTN|nr:sensor histidine kinase [Thermocatellispora tengchongensis]MBB5135655.1 signal transduction histidine kinase [Thermocatellispora tengchongensis]